jgi:hypothetical protein
LGSSRPQGFIKMEKIKKIHVKKDLLRAEGISWSQNVLLRGFIEPDMSFH